jgi:mRNA-degrading endonuclease RelE of RelBE toxin-antitoxin system
MSSDPPPPVQVSFTPEFKRNLRHLAKKYRRIKSDLQPILDELASGSKPGDQVPGVRYQVFKVRAKNSDASKGKSGGYRLIYYVKSEPEVVLITVYSKTEQADVAPEEIRQIILDLEEPAPDTGPEQEGNGAG